MDQAIIVPLMHGAVLMLPIVMGDMFRPGNAASMSQVWVAAFAAELATIKGAAGIPWEVKDVENVYDTADGATNFMCLEFPPAAPPRRMSKARHAM